MADKIKITQMYKQTKEIMKTKIEKMMISNY